MADVAKKGKGGNQKQADGKEKQQAPQQQKQAPAPAANVKESKEEVQPTPVADSEADQVVINPNTNQPNPQVLPKNTANRPPKKERVYHQGTGTVKAVLSGDTLVILQIENGRPVEREIQLTNIEAPKLGRRNREKREVDEAYAFASREFLRKAIIGQPVSFTVEQKSANEKGSREYGYVYLNKDGKSVDLAQLTVGEGWNRVRRRPAKEGQTTGAPRPEVEELTRLEEEAKEKNKGIHNKAGEKTAVRPLKDVTPSEVYEQRKGAPLQGVVERALNGSTLILTLFPTLNEVRLILSGVDCPTQNQDDGEWAPFGREAKFCTEYYLLNRDVQIILEGADKNNLYGTLDLRGNNISEELLKRGLAKYVDWSGNRTAFAEKLKAAEKSAKERKLSIWSTYVEPKALSRQEEKKQIRVGKEILGTVAQIVSASTLILVDGQKNEYTVQLSSVQLPRGGSMKYHGNKKSETEVKNNAPQKSEKEKDAERNEGLQRTYAWEAKEYLRKRLIGQKVRAVLDYIQPAEQQNARNQNQQGRGGFKGQPREEKDRHCYSVYVDKNNVAVELCALGLAAPRNHRGGEQRSKDYEDMLKAETVAKANHKGQHQNPDKASVLYINDISSDADQATKFLPSIKRAKQRGVVVYVFHAAKLKIYVPKENCELTVAISALQVPREKEPFSAESIAFVREKCFQREVEFEVSRVDRGGNFVGAIYVNKENLGLSLLREGFAKLLRADDLENYAELQAGEGVAKKQRKNIWKDYDEVAEQEAIQKRREARNANGKEGKDEKSNYLDIIVTEIIDATTFFYQVVSDAQKLEDLMKNLSLEEVAAASDFKPRVKDLVKAQYTLDDTWYRAQVTAVADDKYTVLYVDYGNSETIPASRIRPLSSKLGKDALDFQAKEAHLAFIKPPTIREDYGQEAAELLRDLVEDKTLMAQIEYRDANDAPFLSLLDGENHLNATFVREGLARVKKPRGREFNFTQQKTYVDKFVNELKSHEKLAKESHTCVWEYGDPGSDEEEERFNPAKAKKDAKDAKKKTAPTSSPATEAKKGKE